LPRFGLGSTVIARECKVAIRIPYTENNLQKTDYGVPAEKNPNRENCLSACKH